MSNRREFIRNGLMTAVAAPWVPGTMTAESIVPGEVPAAKGRHWVWINPGKNDSAAALEQQYRKFAAAGIRGVLFEADSEMQFRTAKKAGLEAHRWNWTMNRGDKELMASHPEWYAISRSGKSCHDQPPYVDYYRWLCPTKPAVQDFLVQEADKILSKDYIDGLHLDYIRFCDVILPLNLWSKYSLVQTQELPDFDFCYCDDCKAAFKQVSGKEIDKLPYPDAVLSWRLFRYRAVNNVVNKLAAVAAKKNKWITAAVFPTPEVARRIVRQDWTNWNLNAVFPMIYHKFYQEEVKWIGDATEEGVHFLAGKFPLYAGLFMPDFDNTDQLREGVQLALARGAAGVSIFGQVTDEVLSVLSRTR